MWSPTKRTASDSSSTMGGDVRTRPAGRSKGSSSPNVPGYRAATSPARGPSRMAESVYVEVHIDLANQVALHLRATGGA